jgi:hypothetical protein
MRSLNQNGSGHIVLIVGLIVVAAVAVAGYRVVQNTDTGTPETSTSVSSNASEPPETIKNTADLNKASASLDNNSIDRGVDPNQLDSDLNALL